MDQPAKKRTTIELKAMARRAERCQKAVDGKLSFFLHVLACTACIHVHTQTHKHSTHTPVKNLPCVPLKKVNIRKPVVETFCAHRSAAGCHFWTSSVSSALGCLTHTHKHSHTHVSMPLHTHTNKEIICLAHKHWQKKQTSIALLLLTFQLPTVLTWSPFSRTHTHAHTHMLSLTHTQRRPREKCMCEKTFSVRHTVCGVF